MGDGNFPAADQLVHAWTKLRVECTLGKTGTQKTRNLLDEGIRCNKRIVFPSQFLDQLLVLVKLLQIVAGHGIDAVVFGPVNVVLVSQYTIVK